MTHTLLLAGGYTHHSSAGICLFDRSGPEPVAVVETIEHPSFLALHPNGYIVYAVSEISGFDGGSGGGIVAFLIDRGLRSLIEIDRMPSGGSGPCHIAVDHAGAQLFVANYESGSVAAIALMEDGRFGGIESFHQHTGSGPHERQDGPHAHCVRPAADGRSFYAVDLGADEIIRYDRRAASVGGGFDAGRTTAAEPGVGPRHIAFHPTEPLAVVVNELANTLTVYAVLENGTLDPLGTESTLPPDASADGLAADVRFHPAGHLVYVSNRGHDSVALFAIGNSTRPLTLVETTSSGGRTPRCMGFHPSGRTLFVANQTSDVIVEFAVDAGSGRLTPTDLRYEMSSPTCVLALEAAG